MIMIANRKAHSSLDCDQSAGISKHRLG